MADSPTPLESLRARWRYFWFEPAPPTNLGVCRTLFFGALFLFYLQQDLSAWGEVSPAFWRPIWAFRVLALPVLSREALGVLQTCWKAALALSCVGLFTRLSTGAACLLGFYLLGLPHNFGKTHHFDALVVLTLGILAVSHCGDGWSMDRLIRARRSPRPAVEMQAGSGEYTWPIRAVWVVMSLVFFGAGVSKIRHSGLDWIFSDNLAIMILQAQYGLSNAEPLTAWGLLAAQHGWVTRSMAALVATCELAYPLALVNRTARWLLVPPVFLMQVGVRVLMGPTFDQYLICNLFWVPWTRAGRAGAPTPP